jgi:FKBP12-rapamycin complex-associated protein
VLRSNKDSVMAMLEAFVHDPLINWRLLNTPTDQPTQRATTATADTTPPARQVPQRLRVMRLEREAIHLARLMPPCSVFA